MYKNFQNDPDAERNGIIQDYGDFRVTLARSGGANKSWEKTLERRTKKYERALATGTMDDDVAEQIMMETFADTVVLDWEVKDEDGNWQRGIEGPDGEVLPFNKENLLLTFKNLPDLYNDLRIQASNSSLYRLKLREEAAKNS
jgi:hypothetical protein